jgi:hypothetical protein
MRTTNVSIFLHPCKISNFKKKLAQIPTAKSQAINGKYMSKTNYAPIQPDLKIVG